MSSVKHMITGFYLVTDSGLSAHGTPHDVSESVKAGCRIIQYREKTGSTREMVNEAGEIKRLCAGKALFLVNDRIDVALAVDADGVHIGQDDMLYDQARALLGPEKVIGVTVHDVAEAVEAERCGADYVGLSPIFETATKQDAGNACGTDMITEVKAHISIPVVAIGGINMENVRAVIASGADSAVAISAVVCAKDVGAAVRSFIDVIGEEMEKNTEN